MSYPWIARPNKTRKRSLQRHTVRLRQLRAAFLLALGGAILVPARPVHADGQLPTGNSTTYGTATVTTNTVNGVGTMTVNQTSDKAIINWQSFNIGQGNTVNFQQPGTTAVALNRIADANPSIIAGNLNANGQIYLINTNGILFATGATVNVNSLTASTLDISDELFEAGILSAANPNAALTPAFAGDGSNGDIGVQSGATLNADANGGGRIMIIAPNVDNQGIITAPDGQIILAAGAKVYLQASNDPNLRGLLVEVSGGGNVSNGDSGNPQSVNLSQLLATHGNITLIGLNVTQAGTARATTSVNANGSIYLLAEDSAPDTAPGTGNPANQQLIVDPGGSGSSYIPSDLKVTATRTGQVTLASNSVTEVALDLDDPATAVDEQAQRQSKITVQGGVVDVQANASIVAHAGTVTLSALQDPYAPTANQFAAAENASRIHIDAGATIDVSGTKDVVLAMDHNLVDVDLRANELADAPLQRDGVLYGETVTVDARVGTTLANVSGAIAAIGRTVAERTTQGGTVNLQSEGDVVINPGATIDVSGGWKTFQSGYLGTTQLVSNGMVYDIGSASPDMIYSGIASNSLGRFVSGYVEGSDAGTVRIVTHSLLQNGSLLGTATAGTYQRALRPEDATLCDLGCQASTRPLGGQLIVGNSTPITNGATGIGLQYDYLLGDVVFGSGSASESIGLNDPLPGGHANLLSNSVLTSGGFSRLAVYSNGLITLPQDTSLSTAPGGSIKLTGRGIAVDGNIDTPGGTIILATAGTATQGLTDNHDLVLGEHAQLTARGLWANDLPQGVSSPVLGATLINGGNVSLTSIGNLSLGTDSGIDVGGGAWVNSSGKLSAGKGGNISLSITHPDAALSLGGSLSGYAVGAGGTLNVTANKVRIDAATDTAQDNTLWLSPDFFQQGGFGNYVVSANVDGLTVAGGSSITPFAANLLLDGDYSRRATGGDITTFSAIATLPNGQRSPVNITLKSNNSAAQITSDATGVLTIESGADITTDVGASIALLADQRIDVEGTLAAPAGTITLRLAPPTNTSIDFGFDAAQSIWLGADSALLASGTTLLTANALGLRWGEVLAGGTVTVDAQRGYVLAAAGSRVDVSGTTGTLDLARLGGGYQQTSVASAGGTLNISASEGVLWDGVVNALPGSLDVMGGTLALTLTRSDASTGCNATGSDTCLPLPNPFPADERRIVVQGSGLTVPDGLTPGQDIPLELNGQAIVNSALLGDSGFDNVTLASDQTIQFLSDPDLSLRGRLALDAPQIALATPSVHLTAETIALGASGAAGLWQEFAPVTAPLAGDGTLTANAHLIELIGAASLSGVADTELNSSGDIRLRGVLNNANAFAALDGSLRSAGDVTLTADQVYATTFSDYVIDLSGADSTLTVNPNAGHSPAPVLSAGSTLTVNAPNIINNGVLTAPLGTINLNAGDRLVLAANSVTSTSAQGQLLPFGLTQNGSDWVYDFGNSNVALLPDAPAKRINLSGAAVDIETGAVVDLSGGGDLYAYEFIPGPGGSQDVLSWSNSPGTYAILPGLGGGSFAPFDQQYYQGTDLQAGDSIYLAGGGGLEAGVYTLLPASYALLPGAYLVSAVSGYRDLAPDGNTPTLLNGATVVAGYRTLSDTGIQADQRWNGYAVRPGDTARLYSEYDDNLASDFFPANAARLPQDAGNLAINTTNSLLLQGSLRAAAAAGGRGAQVDIVAPALTVVASPTDAPDGAVQLTAAELNTLGAESLLLGATRTDSADGTLFSVGASTVTIAQDVLLTGPELLLAASDRVTVASGAQLSTSGILGDTTPDTLILGRDGNGDGALLRISVGPQATILRENTSAATGVLEVQSGSLLSTTGSLALDATLDTQSSGTLAVSGSLSLGASRINLNAPDGAAPGLNLTNTQLAGFTTLSELLLRSYSTVDFYGAATLGTSALENLAIEAAGLRGIDNDGATATLTAGTITLSNPGAVLAQGSTSGTGSLQLHATGSPDHGGAIDTGAGAFVIDGFTGVALTADTQITAHEQGSLTVAGDLTLTTPRLTAAGGSDYSIAADGHSLTVAAPASLPTGMAAAPAAGRLSLTADSVAVAGRVELPAGQLTIEAVHGVTVESGALITTAGVAQSFNNVLTAYMPGGEIALSSENGDIEIASGASIDISGAAQGGDAGQLTLSAPQGAVTLDGTLHGSAAAAYLAGSFTFDANSLGDFSALNQLLNSAGFNNRVDLRARSGDVAIAAQDIVKARDFALTVDQGALAVAGKIDAGGADGGNILLAAAGALTLEQGASLDAHATDTLGDGGSVTLATGANGTLHLDGGSIDVLPGYTTSTDETDPDHPITTVTAMGESGQIHLRAPRGAGNDIAINPGGEILTSFMDAEVATYIPYTDPNLGLQTHLVDVTAEAYRNYTASSIDSTLISTVMADSSSFMSNNAATITNRLGMSGAATFHLTPGIEIDSGGDLTLASTWDLHAYDAAYNGGVAGVLSLRAAGNLNLNSSLSDGFSSALTSASQSTGSISTWSYRLVGGADLDSPDALAVLPTAQLASGSGNVTIANDQLVRTGNGRIDVAAGGDIKLSNQKSVLYTAGVAASALSGFTKPSTFNYATQGGDIALAAQHDVVGAVSNQLISDWIYRQGQLNSNGTIKTDTSWGLSFANFQQNVGALGGGDVTVVAGNDVKNLSAVIPTTGRLAGAANTVPDANNLSILGGGDLTVTAGGDIASGIFYVAQGTGRITAGGALTSARTVGMTNTSQSSDQTPLYTVLALGDGRFDVRARGAVDIQTVLNPTVLPQAPTQTVIFPSLYFTYSADSAVAVSSLAGDVSFVNNNAELANSSKLSFASARGSSTDALSIYPGTVQATAFQGDIVSNGNMVLYPAAQGTLQLLAGGDVRANTLDLSDADPALLPDALHPTLNYREAGSRLTAQGLVGNIHAAVPVHLLDEVPVYIIAGGAIEGQNQGVWAMAKPTQLYAGGAITDLILQGQNLRATDITRVQAGGDISWSSLRTDKGALQVSDGKIEIGGPGYVVVQAGGDIDLGTSKGILTTGNAGNPALTARGADLTVAAGISTPIDYSAFIDRYLDPAGPVTADKYVKELTAYMREQTGTTQLGDADALAQFRALSADGQQAFLLTVFYAELRATGRVAASEAYQRGFDAISTLFPGSSYAGDINLAFSTIRTQAGGAINLLVPGGLVNAGLANPPASLGDIKGPDELGIVAQGEGDVSAITSGDFLVNQSRVFTLLGGNILIWSSEGDIDAGRGAKTAISAPPPLLTTDSNGNTVFSFQGAAQGSGIRVILTSAGVEPGDVDLIAPNGEVNAGDAGIGSAGNLNIAALRVVGADNIQVAGVSSGVPSDSGGLSGGLAGLGNVTGEGGVAESVTKNIGAGGADGTLAYLSVDVLGFGDCKASGDEGCQ